MKVIKPEVQILIQPEGLEGILKHIERCGRICYKSEAKITEDSAVGFVNRMIKSKHYAMLEHGTCYLYIPMAEPNNLELINFFANNHYSQTVLKDNKAYITTNLRVMVENFPENDSWKDILAHFNLEQADINHIKKYTAHWIISRGIANEFVRHRVFSFAQESTRYCNYGKMGEALFIEPVWFDDADPKYRVSWLDSMDQAEDHYLELLEEYSPQFARGVLPLDLKTELVMTGTLDQWKGFFDLRYFEVTGKAHPDAKYIASKWYDILMDQ